MRNHKRVKHLVNMEDFDWNDFERWLERIKFNKRVSLGWFADQIIKKFNADPIEVKNLAVDLGLIEIKREGKDLAGNPLKIWVYITVSR